MAWERLKPSLFTVKILYESLMMSFFKNYCYTWKLMFLVKLPLKRHLKVGNKDTRTTTSMSNFSFFHRSWSYTSRTMHYHGIIWKMNQPTAWIRFALNLTHARAITVNQFLNKYKYFPDRYVYLLYFLWKILSMSSKPNPISFCYNMNCVNMDRIPIICWLTLSWRWLLSYRNQSIDLLCKCDNGLRHERVK